MAMCRQCGCYAAHQSVGLSRPCRRELQGRRARLKRFMQGRHPEPGLKHVVVDCVRHFSRGTFSGYLAGQLSGGEAPPPEAADGGEEPACDVVQPPGFEEPPAAMPHSDADAASELFGPVARVDEAEDEHVLIESGLGFDES